MRNQGFRVIKERLAMKDKEFLEWIWYRLYQVHGEDPFVDYMAKLWSIIEEYDNEKITPNTKQNQHLEEPKKSDQASGGREAMKLNDLYRIQDALEIICESSEATNYEEVVDALIGVCWDEETAGEIKFSMQDDDR